MTEPDAEPKTRGRSWSLAIAASVVTLIVIGGTFAIINARHSDVVETAPPTAEQTQTSRADWGAPYLDPLGRRVEVPPNPHGAALGQDPKLRRDPKAADYLTLAPQGVMWQKVDGTPIPFSTSDGPTSIDDYVPTGFAQTPQGAALAAQQLTARMTASKPGAVAITARRFVFDTPQLRQAGIDRINALKEWPTIALDRIEAYRVTYWAPDYAVIDLTFAPRENEPPVWTTGTCEMLWRNNDWQLKGGSVQGNSSQGGTAANLAGWTIWPGK